MKKIQYSVFRRDTRNASGKAKWDASDILLGMGFGELYEPSNRRLVRVAQQLVHTLCVGKDNLLAVQYPANEDLFYRILRARHVRSFALIHDLESLRMQTGVENDVSALSVFEGVISHNAAMSEVLRSGGYGGHIVDLGLFDYLGFSGRASADRDRSVVSFAGNLSKAGFLAKLCKTGLSVDLFGGPTPGAEALDEQVRYCGSFPSNDVPGRISGGWGLVWDGDSTETCTGLTGEYLRFNCPHKASMYVIAERPLIVWDQSAIAPYVRERGIGIAVCSLTEARDAIASIRENEYEALLEGVRSEKRELASGAHLRRATEEMLRLMGV